MQLLASLSSSEQAAELVHALDKQGIPAESRTTTEETGLDVVEVRVEETQYDEACVVVEAWEAAVLKAAESRMQRRCPPCRSTELEYLDPAAYEKSVTRISYMFRCKSCGHVIAG